MGTKIRANYTEHGAGAYDYEVFEIDDTGEETELGHAYRKADAMKFAAAKEMLELLERISGETAFSGLPDSLQDEVFDVIAAATGDEVK